MNSLDVVYDHKKYEEKWWKFWMDRHLFNAKVDPKKVPYTIVIPPPNVTDRLHMGHGLNATLQDILIRWKRMSGFNACWVPGTDHAGIATQMMVEKSLEAQGIKRAELGRTKFLEKCNEWKEKNGSIITNQQKRIGASCDWSREAYTMSPELSLAVRKIFVHLYEKGLIYRGERLVNWDSKLKTAVSDDEVEMREVQSQIYHYRYRVEGDSGETVTVATTRPETMLGDTAVAVHPDDERYQHLIGKKVRIPFVDRLVPIIADTYVKMEFGTGVVKITPAHDPNDFEVGKRHGLLMINILNEDATLNSVCPSDFRGLDRYEARKKIIKELKTLGLFEKEESIKNAVPYSDRGKVAIEPRLSKQWYVKMKDLADPAIQAAKDGKLRFYPDSWKKTYFHWLENIQDWCISRQLWWGHQIPIWYCNDCDAVATGMTDPEACPKCGSKHLKQDEDVLDTWFSSWLFAQSTFGWPKETPDLKYFYPTNVLITGPDIIFLWVARMVMVGYETLNQLPFTDVYFNSIICDKEGRKFSKTLGNGIDPLEVMDQFGADAVRFTCVNLSSIGGRVRMSPGDFEVGRNFINKLWNAARFLMSKTENIKLERLTSVSLDLPSKWLIQEYHESALAVNKYLENYQFNEAVDRVYQLIWKSFCDWGLESAKLTLDSRSEGERSACASALFYVFEGILRLSAPIIPFVSEEIWSKIPRHPDYDSPESLCVAKYPGASPVESFDSFKEQHTQFEVIQELITGIRSARQQAGVPLKDKLDIFVSCTPEVEKMVVLASPWILKLTSSSKVMAAASVPRPPRCLVAVGRGFEAFVPVGEYLDFDKEKLRLENELKRVSKVVEGMRSKLTNPSFAERAPPEVIELTKSQLAQMEEQKLNLEKNLKAIV